MRRRGACGLGSVFDLLRLPHPGSPRPAPQPRHAPAKDPTRALGLRPRPQASIVFLNVPRTSENASAATSASHRRLASRVALLACACYDKIRSIRCSRGGPRRRQVVFLQVWGAAGRGGESEDRGDTPTAHTRRQDPRPKTHQSDRRPASASGGVWFWCRPGGAAASTGGLWRCGALACCCFRWCWDGGRYAASHPSGNAPVHTRTCPRGAPSITSMESCGNPPRKPRTCPLPGPR